MHDGLCQVSIILNKYSSIYCFFRSSFVSNCSALIVSSVTRSWRSPNSVISCGELVASICSDRCNWCDSSLVMWVFRSFMMAATVKISSYPLISLLFFQIGYAK